MNFLAAIGTLTVIVASLVLVLFTIWLIFDYREVRDIAFNTKLKVDKMLKIEGDNNIYDH